MAETKKKLPIGIDRFEKVRRADFYYVDKTGIIKELLDESCEVNLFTRPRRFGKSLNLDMLACFFEIGTDEILFEGLEIYGHRDLCREHLGQYPVISLNLKDVSGEDYNAAYRALGTVIGRKTAFLIDEYDVPLDKAYQKGYYDQMLEIIRDLLSDSLKSNKYLEFAVLTGCLRIAKESIFTGLNNFVVNSVSDIEYSRYFGFTEDEVMQILQYYELENYQDTIREWYDGYKFGDTWVYCPWDVLNYLRKLRKNRNARPGSFWVNSSTNAIIQNILLEATETTKEQMEMLISGETIEKKLVPELTYMDLDNPNIELRETYLWSVMYATGYLTELEKMESGFGRYKIPNREIWNIYEEKIRGWYNENIRSNTGR